jgi:polyhydroxyalkanoate synthesis regulator phasin
MADRKPSRTDAVRHAVDDAFAAAAGQAQSTAQSTGRRAQDLVDEMNRAAGKVGRAIDDLRPSSSEELRALRREVQALSERVAKLEQDAPDH